LETEKPEPMFTTDDLLAELQAMLPDSEEGPLLRTTELARRLNCSVKNVRRLLHQLRSQGRLIEGRVTIEEGLGGTRVNVPAYGLRKIEETTEEE
jgi:predicted DNA-binding transcriptional regulator YafY